MESISWDRGTGKNDLRYKISTLSKPLRCQISPNARINRCIIYKPTGVQPSFFILSSALYHTLFLLYMHGLIQKSRSEIMITIQSLISAKKCKNITFFTWTSPAQNPRHRYITFARRTRTTRSNVHCLLKKRGSGGSKSRKLSS